MSAFESQITIVNQKGLHARASIKLSELAQNFNCEISISNEKTKADAKNILQLMMLAASKGSKLNLRCHGADAKNAQAAITELIDNKFDEDS